MHKRIRPSWLKPEQGGIQETMLESHHTHALMSTTDRVLILFHTFHTWDKTIKRQKSTPPHWWAIASQMDFSFWGKISHAKTKLTSGVQQDGQGTGNKRICKNVNEWYHVRRKIFLEIVRSSFLLMGGHQVPSNILRQEEGRLQVTCNKWYPKLINIKKK